MKGETPCPPRPLPGAPTPRHRHRPGPPAHRTGSGPICSRPWPSTFWNSTAPAACRRQYRRTQLSQNQYYGKNEVMTSTRPRHFDQWHEVVHRAYVLQSPALVLAGRTGRLAAAAAKPGGGKTTHECPISIWQIFPASLLSGIADDGSSTPHGFSSVTLAEAPLPDSPSNM